MKIVILGDIGWQFLYHLGDEAMTEAAIDMLKQRGVEDITLIAGKPAVAEAFYGLPAVKRAGFSSKWSRERLESHLEHVGRILEHGTFESDTVYAAARDADAVIIAGGGNMNSDHFFHL